MILVSDPQYALRKACRPIVFWPIRFGLNRLVKATAKLGLDLDASVNPKGDEENIPLATAIRWGNRDILTALLENGANPNRVFIESGLTPLHWAAKCQSMEMVKLLLDYGANKRAVTTWNRTAYEIAQKRNNKSLVSILEYEGEKDILSPCVDVYDSLQLEERKPGSQSSLMRTCFKPTLDEFNEELRGSDLELRDGLGNTVLMYAAKVPGLLFKGQAGGDKVQLLLEVGADVNARNYFGQSALSQAAMYESTDIVELLLKEGADANVRNGWGDMTPLMMATRLGKDWAVELLLKRGADKQIKNRVCGYSAIDLSIWFNRTKENDLLCKE